MILPAFLFFLKAARTVRKDCEGFNSEPVQGVEACLGQKFKISGRPVSKQGNQKYTLI